MIPTYYENTDGDKVKVFFAIKDGEIRSTTVGSSAISKKSGIQFYVDEGVSLQLYKMNFSMDGLKPKLELKEGEELEVIEKSEKEKEIERLKKELERLQEEDESRDED